MSPSQDRSERHPVAPLDGPVVLHVVEMDDTSRIFTNPSQQATEDYITGRFG